MELNMNDALVQGAIAAIVQAADTGDLSGFRIELRDAEGRVDSYVSDSSMMRSHTESSPMSLNQAKRLIEDAGLRVFEPAKVEAVA